MTRVRPAGPGDLPGLVPLFLGYLDFYGERAERDEVADYLTDLLEAGDSIVLVAERDAAAIGFAHLFPTPTMASRWILHDLFVAPVARRAGAGRALLGAALEQARERGAGLLSLETAHDNVVARSLYETEGFERDEVFLTYHHDLPAGTRGDTSRTPRAP